MGLRVWVVLKQNGEEPRQTTMVGKRLRAILSCKGWVGPGTRNPLLPQDPGLVESTGKVEARGVEHCFCTAGPYLNPP